MEALAHSTAVSAPATAFLNLLERWSLTPGEGATLLGDSDPALMDDLRSGVAGVASRDRRDRVRYVLDIYTLVNRMLRDPDAERRWIREARVELDGKSLLETLLQGGVEDLILAREFMEDFANR
jgi:hypothetical protein